MSVTDKSVGTSNTRFPVISRPGFIDSKLMYLLSSPIKIVGVYFASSAVTNLKYPLVKEIDC